MIKVLIVDDLAVVRLQLEQILSSDPQVEVVGSVADGEEALEFLSRNKPDVITMDIHMPRLDGLETTRRIMETIPVPIVIVSASREPAEVGKTFYALAAGAVAFIEKPRGTALDSHRSTAAELIRTVKLMSQVKLVRRTAAAAQPPGVAEPATAGRLPATPAEIRIVAIGGSTGAPPVLQEILAGLGKGFPAPIAVVQHMALGFIDGFAAWLETSTGLPVRVAGHGDALLPGRVHVAPSGFQMEVRADGRIALRPGGAEHLQCPSVSVFFRSVAAAFGPSAAGVILTGMGSDGSVELKLIRDRGGVTIAQDEASSVIFGMPGEAVKCGAAAYVLPPRKIAALLKGLASRRDGTTRPGADAGAWAAK